MKKSFLTCFIFGFVILIFLGVVVADTVGLKIPLAIGKVRLDKKVFEPSKGEKVTLSWEVNKESDVTVAIYDRIGNLVRTFNISRAFPGEQSVTWDGRRGDGNFALGQTFLYIIESTAVGGEKVIYNPSVETGGQAVNAHNYVFDAETGKVEYVLPKACMVRLRAGLKQGMLAKTIFDWEPQAAGRHELIWDGNDVSGLMNLAKHADLNINLTCYTLPDNTIIAKGQLLAFEPEEKRVEKTGKETRTDLWGTNNKYIHYTHDPQACHEPRFAVFFPKGKETDEKNVYKISGMTPIRIELDNRDIRNLVNRRFEIMLYIDGVFLFEMEEGTSPFTFNWDTKPFAKGSHILTVNIMSYDDHIGVVSQKVIIGAD